MFCSVAFAHTIEWYVGDNLLSTTTCESGDNITPPTAPDKFGYHLKEWGPYKARIEYLESTGTQWIDTGIKQNDFVKNLILEAVFQPSSNLCGEHLSSASGGGSNYRWYYPLLIRDGYYMTNIWGSGGEKKLAPADYAKHTIKVSLYNGEISFDNKKFVFEEPNSQVPFNIVIFGNNNGSGSPLLSCYKLYSLSLLTADNILLRDFIPVLDPNGTPCMYDKVEHKFYYNAGTGDFIAGPVIGE